MGEIQASAVISLPNVTYGFIGIGIMGYPMAQNLRAKLPPDSLLVVCDVTKSQVTKFVDETKGRIETASTPRQVAETADIIITMLPKGPHVKTVFTDPSTGLLSAQRESSIFFLECSTIDTVTSLEVRDLALDVGHRFLDAPVSGGPSGASAATLTFMVGGTQKLFDEARPILETMGKKENIYFCGKPGAGLATKQINNYLSAICTIGTCEAFNMGRLYGLDPKTLAKVVNVSTGQNYNSSFQNPVKGVSPTASAAKDFEGGFSIELCTGVIEMAVGLGKQVGARSLLDEIVLKSLQEAGQDERCKGKDFRSFYRWLADV